MFVRDYTHATHTSERLGRSLTQKWLRRTRYLSCSSALNRPSYYSELVTCPGTRNIDFSGENAIRKYPRSSTLLTTNLGARLILHTMNTEPPSWWSGSAVFGVSRAVLRLALFGLSWKLHLGHWSWACALFNVSCWVLMWSG